MPSAHGTNGEVSGLRLVSRATALATAGDDPDDIVRNTLDALERVFDAVRADVWKLAEDGTLVHLEGRGVGGSRPLASTEMLADVARDGLAQQLPGSALGEDEATAPWRRLLFQAGCRELGVYSLSSHGTSLGCITLFRKPDAPELGEELTAFAQHVAGAIQQSTARRDAGRAADASNLQTSVLTELASCQGAECVTRTLGRIVGQVDAAATLHLVVASIGGRTARSTTRADGRRAASGRPRSVRTTILDVHARGALALLDAYPAVVDAPTRALFGWGDDVTRDEGMLGMALPVGDETIGWLVLEPSAEDMVQPLLDLLGTIEPAVAVGLDNAMKITSMRLRSERLAAANALARSLGSITDFDVLVDILGSGIEPVLGCTRVAIYDTSLSLLVEHGDQTAPRSELTLARSALRKGTQHRSGAEGTDAFAVSLEYLQAPRAVLYVERPDAVGASFDDHDRALLENVAEQANATLAVIAACEELERNYLSTIQALAGALEASDQYTHDHAQDVAKWAIEVGRRLGMDGRELRDLELGAVFHDIGKIAIPNEILNKPGKLTEAEFEIMKTHTIIGERIIAPISFLERVRPIVRHEHERWDGRGYPDGVAGEDIPLGSRIIFVCDAYHAITSTRPYRTAQPHEVAKRVLEENAGTQFDPAVVHVFLDVIEDHMAGQSNGTLAIPQAHELPRIDIAPARAVEVHRQRDVA